MSDRVVTPYDALELAYIAGLATAVLDDPDTTPERLRAVLVKIKEGAEAVFT